MINPWADDDASLAESLHQSRSAPFPSRTVTTAQPARLDNAHLISPYREIYWAPSDPFISHNAVQNGRLGLAKGPPGCPTLSKNICIASNTCQTSDRLISGTESNICQKQQAWEILPQQSRQQQQSAPSVAS